MISCVSLPHASTAPRPRPRSHPSPPPSISPPHASLADDVATANDEIGRLTSELAKSQSALGTEQSAHGATKRTLEATARELTETKETLEDTEEDLVNARNLAAAAGKALETVAEDKDVVINKLQLDLGKVRRGGGEGDGGRPRTAHHPLSLPPTSLTLCLPSPPPPRSHVCLSVSSVGYG
jgi:hypothetical protein